MKLLYSNIKPCKYSNQSFSDAFEVCVASSDDISIATGYITEESLLELKAVLSFQLDRGKTKRCSLIIGMHYEEDFTQKQYDAAVSLAMFLEDNKLGNVYVCTAFKFHGKTYLFAKSNELSTAILGSSNLGNLVYNRQWEVDAMISDKSVLAEIKNLHSDLINKAAENILEKERPLSFKKSPDLFEGHIGVKKADSDAYKKAESDLTDIAFDIPLKTTPKSNLNAHRGKGRHRNWYEIELIVPISITDSDEYPQKGPPFRVLTDDGWYFNCKVGGENGKNFRSDKKLSILGRWIKGRLENEGCLKVGELATEETLTKYGRRTISLKKTSRQNLWLLDFAI